MKEMKYYVVEGKLRVRGVVRAETEDQARRIWHGRLKKTASERTTPQVVVQADADSLFVDAAEIPALR